MFRKGNQSQTALDHIFSDCNRVPSWHNTNLALSWRGEGNLLGNWVTSFNITNLFDRDPSQRGLTTVGDEIGRRYSLGFATSF